MQDIELSTMFVGSLIICDKPNCKERNSPKKLVFAAINKMFCKMNSNICREAEACNAFLKKHPSELFFYILATLNQYALNICPNYIHKIHIKFTKQTRYIPILLATW